MVNWRESYDVNGIKLLSVHWIPGKFYKYGKIMIYQKQFNCFYNNKNLLFIHTLFNCEWFTKVRALSSLRTSLHPSHLIQPHQLLDVKSLLSVIVGYFLTEGNYLGVSLELGIQTFLLQTHRSARGERLTDLATKTGVDPYPATKPISRSQPQKLFSRHEIFFSYSQPWI